MNARAMTGFLLAMFILSAFDVRAEEEGGARVGPGKAVTEANAKDGMRLSGAALKRLGVSFQDAKRGGAQEIPSGSLVVSREETSIYRLRDGWIKRVEVDVQARSAKIVKIRSKKIEPGDRIVVAGASFLRMAEIDVLGSEKEEGDER